MQLSVMTNNPDDQKVTGKDCKIKDIAIKKTLGFYEGRPKGVRTNWVMHDYSPTFHFPTQRDFVICKIKKRLDVDDEPTEEGDSSTVIVADTRSQSWNNYGSTFEGQEDTQIQAYVQSFHGYNEMDYNLDYAFQW
ncbi:hypothetical protein RCOM_1553240 [Ricinus communis]|uniref:NAC domain-containing protein n=1 Tax=Ricinus communis TaxID=3988 RepID=B9S3P7_RICCO|nr:hypothetical protein RCOM_1553240 [Ricinus communis]